MPPKKVAGLTTSYKPIATRSGFSGLMGRVNSAMNSIRNKYRAGLRPTGKEEFVIIGTKG